MWGLVILLQLLYASCPSCHAQNTGMTNFTTNLTCSVVLSGNDLSDAIEVSARDASPTTNFSYSFLGSHLSLPQEGYLIPESLYRPLRVQLHRGHLTKYSLDSVMVGTNDTVQWTTSVAGSLEGRKVCSDSAPILTKPGPCPMPTCDRMGREWTSIMLATLLGILIIIILCLVTLACLQHKEICRLRARIDIVLVNIARENQKFTRQEEHKSCCTDTGTPPDTCGTTGGPSYTSGTTGGPSHTWGTTGNPSHTWGTTGEPSHTWGTTGDPSHTWGTTGDPSHTWKNRGNSPNTTTMDPLHSLSPIKNLLEDSDKDARHLYANINNLVAFGHGPLITSPPTEAIYQTIC